MQIRFVGVQHILELLHDWCQIALADQDAALVSAPLPQLQRAGGHIHDFPLAPFNATPMSLVKKTRDWQDVALLSLSQGRIL